MNPRNERPHSLGQPTRFLQLSNATLPYWRRGQGPDLVFFHGWPFDSRTWLSVAQALQDDFTCHLFDLPGAGLSRISANTSLTLDAHVQTALEGIDAMHIEAAKLGVIGHDSGGSIARLVAASMPDKIFGMVFANTEVPNRYSPLFRRLLRVSHWPGAASVFQLLLRSKTIVSKMALVGRHNKQLNQQLVETYIERLADNDRALYSAFSLLKSVSLKDFDQLAEAQLKVTAPVHLVWGRRDPWFPLKDAKTMLNSFGGKVELTVIDQAALMVHEEVPDEFAAAVRATMGPN